MASTRCRRVESILLSCNQGAVMTSSRLFVGVLLALPLAALAAAALSVADRDKYTLKVPGGLAFSEFEGYESWQTISVSKSDKAMAVILGNPTMIEAYQAGLPGNGKPFPDGAKMA